MTRTIRAGSPTGVLMLRVTSPMKRSIRRVTVAFTLQGKVGTTLPQGLLGTDVGNTPGLLFTAPLTPGVYTAVVRADDALFCQTTTAVSFALTVTP